MSVVIFTLQQHLEIDEFAQYREISKDFRFRVSLTCIVPLKSLEQCSKMQIKNWWSAFSRGTVRHLMSSSTRTFHVSTVSRSHAWTSIIILRKIPPRSFCARQYRRCQPTVARRRCFPGYARFAATRFQSNEKHVVLDPIKQNWRRIARRYNQRLTHCCRRPATIPDVAAYQAELNQLVKVALDQLPALYADTLECKYVHGYSVRDIAGRIGKSEKATESILTRARIVFRECFASLIHEDSKQQALGIVSHRFSSNAMNDPFEKNRNGASDMDEIGRLINFAGAREAVPGERFERVQQNVRAHWQQVVAEQHTARRSQRFNIIAIAASLVLVAATTLVLWNLSYVLKIEPLASVERVLGEVQIRDESAQKHGHNCQHTNRYGDTSRIALRMSGGQSLRIDTASQVIVHSPNHISLESGAIYMDTAFSETEEPILVSTPLGSAQDIGTQFQVRVTPMLLVVGVRQGLVEITQPGQQTHSVNKGYYVELSDAGESSQHPLQPGDPDWAWIETVAPEFNIQGASLEQYLQWYVSERGVDLVWADFGI